MRLHPIAYFGGTGEIGGDAGGRQHRRRRLAARRPVAECDVAQCHQQAAMRTAACIGVLGQDTQTDHEGPVLGLTVEEWPVMIEEGTTAEQRLEALGRVGFPLTLFGDCFSLTSRLDPPPPP